ncbi:hypothetical protein [Frigoribacterium sp. VKM Ac-2860]|uniref:hypothetical protein n=1 Tax=unclassified Frigoribacterium TaxID=2627005 RepID=UPI00352F611C
MATAGDPLVPLDPAATRLEAPAGATVDADGTVVVMPGEGRYELDRTAGTVLFTPVPAFTGPRGGRAWFESSPTSRGQDARVDRQDRALQDRDAAPRDPAPRSSTELEKVSCRTIIRATPVGRTPCWRSRQRPTSPFTRVPGVDLNGIYAPHHATAARAGRS